MARKFFTITLMLVALVVATIAAAWLLLHNEAFLKSQLADIVFRQTGRALTVKGLLRLDLGRETTLEARDIRLQNAAWANDPYMVTVGHLLVTVDLPSLLEALPTIQNLVIEDCSINLLRNNAGDANWDVLPESGPEPHGPAPVPPGPKSLPVVLKDLQIRNCRVDFKTPDRDQPLVTEVDNMALQTLPDNSIEGRGAGRIDGQKLSFSGRYSPLGASFLEGPHKYDMNLRLGDLSLQSSGTLVDITTLTGADIKTRFSGPEIGQVLKTFSLPPVSEGPFDFRLDLDSGGRMTKLKLDGDLGKLVINASGQLDHLARPRSGKVHLKIKGPDLQALGATFGVTDLVPEPFSIQGDVVFDNGAIKAQPLIVKTSADRLEVSGVLGPAPDFADSSLDIRIISNEISRWHERLSLPATMRGSLHADSQLSSNKDGIFSVRAELKMANIFVQASGILGSMKGALQPRLEFNASAANLHSLGTLAGIDKLPAAPLSARGKIDLTAREIHFQDVNIDLAGHDLLVNGLLSLGDNYKGSELKVKFKSPDIAKLGRLFGHAEFPQQALKLNADLKLDGKGLAFRVSDTRPDEFKLALDGRIVDLNNPLGIDATFNMRLPGLDTIAFLLPETPLPQGPFAVQGSLKNDRDRTQLENVQLQLGQAKATIDGTIQHDSRFQLTIRANAPDASILKDWTGKPLAPDPFSMAASLAGNPSEFEFTDLDVRLGKSAVGGHLKIGLGELTRISGQLDSAFLDLSQWLNIGSKTTYQAAAPSRYLFNDTPVMKVADYGVALDLDINVDRLDFGNHAVQDVKLGLRLNPNHLELNPLSLRGRAGGRISGTGVLDNSGDKPRFDLKLSGQDLFLGFGALADQDPATYPPLDIDLVLQGSGLTLHELASSLDGKVRANYRSGLIASAGLSLWWSDFATELLSTLNPFQKSTEYTKLSCAVLAADISNGMVNVFPIVVQTAQVTILSHGTVDLRSEKVDFSFTTKTRKGLGVSVSSLINPFIKVGGSLVSPTMELDPAGSVIKGGVAVATVGLSLLARSMTDRFLSSKDPCGDALSEIAKKDGVQD